MDDFGCIRGHWDVMGVFGGLTGSWGGLVCPFPAFFPISCTASDSVSNPTRSNWIILCAAQGQGGVHFAQTCFPRQELRKFMREVKRGNPTAAITLQVSYISFWYIHCSIYLITCVFQYDKLYVDNKCYVWNDLQVKVGFPYKCIFWYLVESLFIFHRAAWLSLPQGNKVLTDQPFTRFVGKVFFGGKPSLCSGTLTFAHKIQTLDLRWCVEVRFEQPRKDERWLLRKFTRSPVASTEKDDRIRELEIMVRSLEEKLTR